MCEPNHMLKASIEFELQLEEIRRLVSREAVLPKCCTEPCPGGCGALWPRSRVKLARQGCKFDQPLARTVQFCRCDLWVPCLTSEATYVLQLACVTAYCNTLYRRAALEERGSWTPSSMVY